MKPKFSILTTSEIISSRCFSICECFEGWPPGCVLDALEEFIGLELLHTELLLLQSHTPFNTLIPS